MPFLFETPGMMEMFNAVTFVVGYVDPGSGLLVWQLLVAAVVGVAFYLKKSRDFLKQMLRKLLHRNRP